MTYHINDWLRLLRPSSENGVTGGWTPPHLANITRSTPGGQSEAEKALSRPQAVKVVVYDGARQSELGKAIRKRGLEERAEKNPRWAEWVKRTSEEAKRSA